MGEDHSVGELAPDVLDTDLLASDTVYDKRDPIFCWNTDKH